MAFLYHLVPPAMQGSVLYPLNDLKDIYPDTYAYEIKKYEGREHVMEQKIPPWNCEWNDALFLSPVDPAVIKRTLQELGFPFQKEISYYEIDAKVLDPKKTIVFLFPPTKKKGDTAKEEDFLPYNSNDMEKYTTIPEATVTYFKKAIANGRKPLLYVYIPHILYRGGLDVNTAKIRTA